MWRGRRKARALNGKCARAINNWKSLIRVKGALSFREASSGEETRHLHLYNLCVHWRSGWGRTFFYSETFLDRVAIGMWIIFIAKKILLLRLRLGGNFDSCGGGLSPLHHFTCEARTRSSLVSWKSAFPPLPSRKYPKSHAQNGRCVWCHAMVNIGTFRRYCMICDIIWWSFNLRRSS